VGGRPVAGVGGDARGAGQLAHHVCRACPPERLGVSPPAPLNGGRRDTAMRTPVYAAGVSPRGGSVALIVRSVACGSVCPCRLCVCFSFPSGMKLPAAVEASRAVCGMRQMRVAVVLSPASGLPVTLPNHA